LGQADEILEGALEPAMAHRLKDAKQAGLVQVAHRLVRYPTCRLAVRGALAQRRQQGPGTVPQRSEVGSSCLGHAIVPPLSLLPIFHSRLPRAIVTSERDL